MNKRVQRGSLALLSAAVLASSSDPRARAAASDWPQWRGPNRDAVSSETGLLTEWKAPGPRLAWKTTGLGDGFSSVSVAGGRIFTMGDREGAQHVVALSQTDGKRLWTAKVGPPHQDEYGGPRGTPTVDGDLVYALGTDSITKTASCSSCRQRPMDTASAGRSRSPTRS